MLRSYLRNGNCLAVSAGVSADRGAATQTGKPIWFDLVNPTSEEDKLVEDSVGIRIPTREEMQEIEVSARLYPRGRRGVHDHYRRGTAGHGRADDDTITFVLKGSTLILGVIFRTQGIH